MQQQVTVTLGKKHGYTDIGPCESIYSYSPPSKIPNYGTFDIGRYIANHKRSTAINRITQCECGVSDSDLLVQTQAMHFFLEKSP